MSPNDWSDKENDAVVASYFVMLCKELAGLPYNKAANNRMLQKQIGRNRSAIEFKFCNVSAAAKAFGLPVIKGYQPRFNFQMSLADAISRWLTQHPDWDISFHQKQVAGLEEYQTIFLGISPTFSNTPPPKELEQSLEVAHRFDIAGRDERNRKLGQAGEEVVFHHERSSLRQVGRDDLAGRVRWISKEDGDGAGYDISSFTPEGEDRLIEVKTTYGGDRTPFYISRNELKVAEAHRESWLLFRVYDFAQSPKAFELFPPLEAHVSLIATNFEANFK
jgi:hypothetical protein